MDFSIIFFAALAAFLIYKLHNILGKEDAENDLPPLKNPFIAAEQKDGRFDFSKATIENTEVKTASQINAPEIAVTAIKNASSDITNFPPAISHGLGEIARNDKNFETHNFISGSAMAFEMIITAFANGDRETLKHLLSKSLYNNFNNAITAREAKEETQKTEILRIKEIKLIKAGMEGNMAEITLRFKSEQNSLTYNKNKEKIKGDANQLEELTDIWTFTKDTRTNNPNWLLIETRNDD